MQTNKAFRIHGFGGPEAFQLDEIAVPKPGPGHVLVAVKAVGMNALDWKIRNGFMRDAMPLALPAVLGSEAAGTVSELGEGVEHLALGERVMGLLAGMGAHAELVVFDAANLARTPEGLSDTEAAAVPAAALTAWQALRATGELTGGKKILIHGAAGGVGGFAIQFAKQAGAYVMGTGSGSSREYITSLGADMAIDYRTERFEDRVKDADLVLDLVGGGTLDRSWQVVADGGAVVSTTTPEVEKQAPAGKRGVFLSMRPDGKRLGEMAEDVAAGRLRSKIARIFRRDELPEAVEQSGAGHAPGKLVVDFTK